MPLERSIEDAARVGNHKTSMLQDIESGRATEIDALLGSVIELAHLTGTAVPRIETVYARTRLLEESVRMSRPLRRPPDMFDLDQPLSRTDPILWRAKQAEARRQEDHLELIAVYGGMARSAAVAAGRS